MELDKYENERQVIDSTPRLRASQEVARAHRQRDTEPLTPAVIPPPIRQSMPLGVAALLLVVLMVGMATYQLTRTPTKPLQVQSASTPTVYPTSAPSVGEASPAPTSAPQPTDAPRFTPAPVQPAQSGRGLTVDNSAGAEVATPTPEPPAEPTPAPSYIENVGAQAPHSPRGDGQPGPNGAAEGDWALVPTAAPAMLEVIGNQVPHKVR